VLIENKFVEDTRLSNIKIAVGFISCVLAALSHFWPTPFPANKPLLICCVALYIILSFVLQYITSHIEKDFIWFSLRTSVFEGAKTAVEVATSLGKYQDTFTMSIARRGKPNTKVEKKENVAHYFHSDGFFAQQKFENQVKQLLNEYLIQGSKKEK